MACAASRAQNKHAVFRLPGGRKGYNDGADVAHEVIPQLAQWGAAAVTLHGRTRQQRYSRQADWSYIQRCGAVAQGAGLPLVGNGDIMSYQDWAGHMAGGAVTTCMIGRGALIKPWIFTGAWALGWCRLMRVACCRPLAVWMVASPMVMASPRTTPPLRNPRAAALGHQRRRAL